MVEPDLRAGSERARRSRSAWPPFSACGPRSPAENWPAVDRAILSGQTDASPDRREESLEAQRQIRQLRDTVAALRAQMEATEAGRAAAVQQAVAAGADEIRLLRTTISTLRDELQALQATRETDVQAAVAAGHDEARQLHLTIQTLRDQLERELFAHKDALAQQHRAHQDELRQLHEAIAALRTKLEKSHGS